MNLQKMLLMIGCIITLQAGIPALCMIASKECDICLMDKQDDEFVCLSCDHSHCCECLEAMVDLSIREKDTSYLKCPECKTFFSQRDIRAATNSQKAENIADIATREWFVSQNQVKQCPTPNCPYVFLNEADCSLIFTCPGCNQSYCSECLVYHTSDITCYQARDRVDLDAQTSKWLKENTTECPKCKAHIERAGGCMFVQCRFCKHQFCWNCHGTHHEVVCRQPRAQISRVYAPQNNQSSTESAYQSLDLNVGEGEQDYPEHQQPNYTTLTGVVSHDRIKNMQELRNQDLFRELQNTVGQNIDFEAFDGRDVVGFVYQNRRVLQRWVEELAQMNHIDEYDNIISVWRNNIEEALHRTGYAVTSKEMQTDRSQFPLTSRQEELRRKEINERTIRQRQRNVNLLNMAKNGGEAYHVRELLDAGADVNAEDMHGSCPRESERDSPLSYAVKNRYEQLVRIFLDYGAHIHEGGANDRNKQAKILNEAVRLASLEHISEEWHQTQLRILLSLLDRGADVNIKNKIGTSLLHLQADPSNIYYRARRIYVAQVLIDYGADVDAQKDDGDTPLHFAVQNNDIELAYLLVRNGASLNITNRFGCTPLQLLEHLQSIRGPQGNLISYQSSRNYVRWVLTAAINGEDYDSVVHKIRRIFDSGILNTGVKVDTDGGIQVNPKNDNAPLNYAITTGNEPSVGLFIEYGADVDDNSEGMEPLRNAAQSASLHHLYEERHERHIRILRLLLDRGADVNIRTINGTTPLHHMITNVHRDIRRIRVARILIDYGTNVDAQDKNGDTPLHYAVRANDIDMVYILIHNGATLDIKNKTYKTPIQILLDQAKQPRLKTEEATRTRNKIHSLLTAAINNNNYNYNKFARKFVKQEVIALAE